MTPKHEWDRFVAFARKAWANSMGVVIALVLGVIMGIVYKQGDIIPSTIPRTKAMTIPIELAHALRAKATNRSHSCFGVIAQLLDLVLQTLDVKRLLFHPLLIPT